jgi:hypothetical protein
MGSESPLVTPPHHQIHWATPPTGASEDSEGVPLRFRTIPNLLDTTEEVQGFEYSGVCLVEAEEPRTIEEALFRSMLEEGYGSGDESH